MSITRDDWLAALAEVAPRRLELDQSAMTAREFAELVGCSHCTAQRQLKKLEAKGRVERVQKIYERNGVGPTRVMAYRLIGAHDDRSLSAGRHARRLSGPRRTTRSER